MPLRADVQALVDLGPLPSEEAEVETIARYQTLLHGIARPVSRDEALALLRCFGPDEAYGLAWSLVHLVETAPGGPLFEHDPGDSNEWHKLIWTRSQHPDARFR